MTQRVWRTRTHTLVLGLAADNGPYGYLVHLHLPYTPLTCDPDLPPSDDAEGLTEWITAHRLVPPTETRGVRQPMSAHVPLRSRSLTCRPGTGVRQPEVRSKPSDRARSAAYRSTADSVRSTRLAAASLPRRDPRSRNTVPARAAGDHWMPRHRESRPHLDARLCIRVGRTRGTDA